jgi:hypothetical protein
MIQLVGLLLPPLIDLINRKFTSKDTRFWVSVLVCFVTGTALTMIETNGFELFNGLSWLEVADAISQSSIMVFGLAQLSYKGFYEDSELQTSIRSI